MKKIILALATGFGSGYAPVASGTFGTLVAILFYLGIYRLPPPYYLLFCITFIVLAIYVSSLAEVHFGEKDSGKIVIDEIAGYLVAMFMIPPSWITVIAAFFIFRFFDILKPPPARYIERSVPSGAGVVLDDVMAGIYTWIVMFIIFGAGL